MTRYLLTPAARADLEQIWDYTCERWDLDQAQDYVREIRHAIERVADAPKVGRACDEVRPGYRKHGVGSHTLYYGAVGIDAIEVVRILHRRMDVDRQFD